MSAIPPRVELIAQALEHSAKIHEALTGIDLRTTRGDTRQALRAAREDTAGQLGHLYAALRAEAPGTARVLAAFSEPEVPT